MTLQTRNNLNKPYKKESRVGEFIQMAAITGCFIYIVLQLFRAWIL